MGDIGFDRGDDIGNRSRGTSSSWDAPDSVTVTPTKLEPKAEEPGTAQVAPVTSGRAPTASIRQPNFGGPKKPQFDMFTPESHATPGPDEGAGLLAAGRDATGRRLADAQKALEDSKQLSPGEKIAMALVGLLPAIGGSIVGAAIHNPTSVAAGISGGLEGSSKGVGMLNQDVKDRVELARKKVEQEQGNLRSDDKDVLGRQIHDVDYARGLKDQDLSERNQAGMKGTEERNNAALHMYLGDQSSHTAIEVERMRAAAERAKEGRAWGDAGAAKEKSFAETIQAGRDALSQLKQRVKSGGNWSAWIGGDEAHKSDLEQLPKLVAAAQYQALHPGARPSVAEEARMAASIRTGLFTPTSRTNADLEAIEKTINTPAEAHGIASPSGAPPQSVLGSGPPKDVYGF